jgi:methyl-accepting chemotaxis protein
MSGKFVLALALPLLATLWFAGTGVLERQRLASNMAQMEALSEMSVSAGYLVHHLQRERGMTAGYIGSRGQTFQSRLTAQHPQTDEQIAGFESAISALELDRLDDTFIQGLATVRRELADLQRVRRDTLNLSINNDQAVAEYTEITRDLMATIGRVAHLAADPGITRRLGAYTALLQAKDLAGVERAMLTNAFSSNVMTGGAYQRMLTLFGREASYLDSFHTLANDEQSQQLTRELSAPQIAQALEMRQTAIDRGIQGMYGIEAETWFDLQTTKLERMKSVEDAVAAGVIADAVALRSAARQSLMAYLIIASVATLAAIALALLTVRSLLGPLQRNLKDIQERGGDLTRRLEVPGTDELSRLYTAFNQASSETETLVANIQQSSLSVEVASGEIAQGNQDLAQRTEEQSASLVETASSMEQITATVRHTADNARQAETMTEEMTQEAAAASEVAERASNAMQQIHTSNKEVTTIVEAIDNIAFQTNLLALNASVEAARAGEHGRGFAVVAQEVRKLASRSAEEAEQIKRLIANNVARINEGETLVGETTQTLQTIALKVANVATLVRDMSAATGEQSAGIEQINQAVAQLEEVTQQNAALVEQVAAASRSLDDQAADMAKLVGQFKVSGTPQQTWKPQAQPAQHPEFV